MLAKPQLIGIVTKGSEDALRLASDVLKHIKERYGIRCLIDELTASKLGLSGVKIEDMQVDLAIAIGGDGTILRLAQKMKEPSTPILGINLGALGFLSSVEPEEAIWAIDRIFSRDFYLEDRMKLASTCDGEKLPDALNEILIITNQPSKVINIEVVKDNIILYKGKLDGLILSTATGSTAYALSAGGVLIEPDLNVIEVAFICPVDVGVRPIILSADANLKIRVLSDGARAQAVVDGQHYRHLNFNSEVLVSRSRNRAVFVVFDKERICKKFKARMGIRNVS